MSNYAFIDGNNLYLGINKLGWRLDYRKFRVYLKDKYAVQKAYYFIGYIPENERLYTSLKADGYDLVFKPVASDGKGHLKGNCDAELVLQAMIEYNNYDKGIIVSGDGDFTCLARHLQAHNKLATILAPNKDGCSSLLCKEIRSIAFMDYLENKLGRT
ncbi:MAG: NYN domain-containing protein [bacterium]|nr:NYN domain-containing protein [bacterium]